MKHDIFVYGTLKRGGSNHRLLADQTFVALARTEPIYKIYAIGDYPAMVEAPLDGHAIEGEIWSIDRECLIQLDRLEGLEEGLYKRVPIQLQPPHDTQSVEGYIYLQSITGRRDCGTAWPV